MSRKNFIIVLTLAFLLYRNMYSGFLQKTMAAVASGVLKVLPAGARIGYVTDAEGNLDYFRRYVARSEVVFFDNAQLELRDETSYFVFGGDVCDKGPGDIRLVNLLVNLKQRYPERVFLLLGNRDFNKLRFTSELHHEVLSDASRLTDRSFPYWVDEPKRVTPADFLQKKQLSDNIVSRVIWMLNETMGSEGSFELRRQELAVLKDVPENQVSDDEVVASYRHSVEPGHENAFMLKYFRAGHMAVRLGSHLFVHGAVTEANLGRVPGRSDVISNVDDWVKELNVWTQKQLDEHEQKPRLEPGTTRNRGGDALMDYGVPNGNGGATVVYSSNLDNGNAAPIRPAVANFLSASGVHSVLTGHVPHGDCPTVIITGDQRIITADTSYSDMSHKDNRGIAVSEVLVYENGRAHVHGVLKDNRPIDYWLPSLTPSKHEDKDDDCYVGHQLKDGSWVKAKLKDEDKYIACKGVGFKLNIRELTGAEVQAELL